MKRIATAALALSLMSGASAFAEPNHDHSQTGGSPHAGGEPHSGAPQVSTGHTNGPPNLGPSRTFTDHAGGNPNSVQGAPNNGEPQVRGYHSNGPSGSQTFTPDSRNFHRDDGGQNFDHNRGPPNSFRPGAPGFRPGGQRPRYSQQFFPRSWNPGNRYHWQGSRWFNPPGFHYRRWGYGEFWPFAWLSPQWYINDYYDYDLPVPPYGYEWVRNGPDALLVNLDNGMIVEVVPNLYY